MKQEIVVGITNATNKRTQKINVIISGEKGGETSRLNSLLSWYMFKVVEEGWGERRKSSQ